VRLNEILADPPADLAGDANRDGTRDASDDEFVEILNCGGTTVDLSGWTIADDTSMRHVFTASGGGLGLANTGDVVYLRDGTGAIVDVHAYGSEGGKDQAMIRYPDCTDAWMLCSDAGLEAPFSPQQPNDGQSAVTGSTWGSIKSLFE
jgi:hypothetical protein